ncbi:MAG: Flp pilus assembly protein CpaB [Pirellulaceae bacterium]
MYVWISGPRIVCPKGLTDLSQIEGKFVSQGIFANEPILSKKLADNQDSLAILVPKGYRVFDIECSAGYIKPGDHVDVLGTFKVRGKNSPPESRTVLRNVEVCGINGITTRDSEALQQNGATKGTIFQLLVKEGQLEALTTARSIATGNLTLNLRGLSEGDVEDANDNGEMFLTWLSQAEESAPEVDSNRTQQVFSSIEAMFGNTPKPSKAATPKQEMLIITPEGVSKYEWSDDNEMPQRVEEPRATNGSNGYAEGSGSPWETSGNVYSGYGGYSPTYPTSTAPLQPPTPGLPQPATGNAEAKAVN